MAANGAFRGWTVVAGSGFGIAFGTAVFIGSSFSLLAAAMGAQFGWSQSELAKGASIALLSQIVGYPGAGWFLDRFGSRRVAMASIVLFALALAFLSQTSNALWRFYLAFVLIGLLASGTNVISYARAITLWFDRRRGLALGVAAGFQALGALVMPVAMQKIIGFQGWPAAVLTLAVFEVVVCLPLVAMLVKDDPNALGLGADGETAPASRPSEPAFDTRAVVASASFWKLALAFAVMGMSFYALATNIAFVLTKSAGLSLDAVAKIQAISGLSVLLGRVGFGYLLDKLSARIVGLIALALAAIAFVGFAVGSTFAAVALAAALSGATVGGESDLMPYFAGRYFGAPAVSKVFGWFLSAYVLGAAIGPVAFARASEIFGGPSVPLYALAALQLLPALLFLGLGPYPGSKR